MEELKISPQKINTPLLVLATCKLLFTVYPSCFVGSNIKYYNAQRVTLIASASISNLYTPLSL
jgi:hypothetical protein